MNEKSNCHPLRLVGFTVLLKKKVGDVTLLFGLHRGLVLMWLNSQAVLCVYAHARTRCCLATQFGLRAHNAIRYELFIRQLSAGICMAVVL